MIDKKLLITNTANDTELQIITTSIKYINQNWHFLFQINEIMTNNIKFYAKYNNDQPKGF